jgi:RNA dependent RNA polymerase
MRAYRGKRSLPSRLSGGDLDGDEYNLILNVSHTCHTFDNMLMDLNSQHYILPLLHVRQPTKVFLTKGVRLHVPSMILQTS